MKKIGGFISIVLILIAYVMKCVYGSAYISQMSILFMVAFLVLLIFEVLPISLTCFAALGIMPVIGISADFNSALCGFSNQVVFFVLASFGLAMALTKVPLSKRLLKKMIQHFGQSSGQLVFAFMVCASLLSSIISNVPTCAVFLSMAMNLLELYKEDERKQMGKTLMIGIPIASMIGGVATPAGSSLNLMAMNFMEKYVGTSISFVQWMCLGIPAVLILLPINWFILVKKFPPVQLESDKLDQFVSNMNIPEKFNVDEVKVLVVSSIMFLLWILSSWIPEINVMLVAVVGCVVFCMPKFGVLNINDFLGSINWDTFFLVGTVLSMGSMLVNNGVNDMIIRYLPRSMGLPAFLALLYIALLTFLLLVVIPTAPTLLTFLSPVIIQLAKLCGINPIIGMTVFAICISNNYLFPLDVVCLITYSKGYYKMSDMFKVSLPTQIFLAILIAVIGFISGTLFGWI